MSINSEDNFLDPQDQLELDEAPLNEESPWQGQVEVGEENEEDPEDNPPPLEERHDDEEDDDEPQANRMNFTTTGDAQDDDETNHSSRSSSSRNVNFEFDEISLAPRCSSRRSTNALQDLIDTSRRQSREFKRTDKSATSVKIKTKPRGGGPSTPPQTPGHVRKTRRPPWQSPMAILPFSEKHWLVTRYRNIFMSGLSGEELHIALVKQCKRDEGLDDEDYKAFEKVMDKYYDHSRMENLGLDGEEPELTKALITQAWSGLPTDYNSQEYIDGWNNIESEFRRLNSCGLDPDKPWNLFDAKTWGNML